MSPYIKRTSMIRKEICITLICSTGMHINTHEQYKFSNSQRFPISSEFVDPELLFPRETVSQSVASWLHWTIIDRLFLRNSAAKVDDAMLSWIISARNQMHFARNQDCSQSGSTNKAYTRYGLCLFSLQKKLQLIPAKRIIWMVVTNIMMLDDD